MSIYKLIVNEIRGSLPGKHNKTSLLPPDSNAIPGFDEIHTGSQQGDKLLSNRAKFLGYLTWITWFGIGIRFWWFSDTTFLEYIVATILWMLTFAFTILGIPITRALLKIRRAK